MARKFTKKEVADAIEKSSGIMSHVATLLQCHWTTADRYVKLYELEDELTAEDERVTDLAESKLVEAIEAGRRWAVEFRLKTKGKSRGYSERIETAEVQVPMMMNIKKSYMKASHGGKHTEKEGRSNSGAGTQSEANGSTRPTGTE